MAPVVRKPFAFLNIRPLLRHFVGGERAPMSSDQPGDEVRREEASPPARWERGAGHRPGALQVRPEGVAAREEAVPATLKKTG